MDTSKKATRIRLFDFKSIQMRSFHITWLAFFLCFFGWFGIAPLMAVVRSDLALTKGQIGNIMIASVAMTVIVRLIIGPLCDKYGPRKTYTALLVLGSIPVMMIGLAQNYETFLLARLAIGSIGASFVITQYHTSTMFAPNVVGTANATTAGWGNLGGGVTQMVMPLVLAAVLSFGVGPSLGWRLAMIVPAIAMLLTAIPYWFLTTDCPEGNFSDLRAAGKMPEARKDGSQVKQFLKASSDSRVWALFVAYGACFGVELIIHNIAAIYYFDKFGLNLESAGLVAGSFGLTCIFARTLGGWLSDRLASIYGLMGRTRLLFAALLLEGLFLMLFSQISTLALAVTVMITAGIFLQIATGATYGLVPFINRKALGSVSGIVGAGGNAGAVLGGFLFKAQGLTYQGALFYLGAAVAVASFAALAVRFSPEVVKEERLRFDAAVAERNMAAIPAE